MKKVFVALMLIMAVTVGFGMSVQSAHAQTAAATETISAADLNVLGQTLSVFKSVLDEIQARLDAHAIPESSFAALNATLEGMKGNLLTIRGTLAQSASGSVPVAAIPEPVYLSANTESQPASSQSAAAVSAKNVDVAQQSASIGLIARHPTASLWVGLIVFALIIGILLFARTRSDTDSTEQKPKETVPDAVVQQTDTQ